MIMGCVKYGTTVSTIGTSWINCSFQYVDRAAYRVLYLEATGPQGRQLLLLPAVAVMLHPEGACPWEGLPFRNPHAGTKQTQKVNPRIWSTVSADLAPSNVFSDATQYLGRC